MFSLDEGLRMPGFFFFCFMIQWRDCKTIKTLWKISRIKVYYGALDCLTFSGAETTLIELFQIDTTHCVPLTNFCE